MFLFQKNSEEFIYHYTKAETAIDYILANKNLKLSSFSSTNDPKEIKNWFFIPGTNEERNMDKYTPEYLSTIMNPVLKEQTSLLCFSKDKPLTGNHMEDNPKRGFCKPRMWAQYGGNHTGVCLIFDFNRFSALFNEQFKDKTYRYDHVQYKDRLISEIQMDQAFIVNIDHLENRGKKDYAYDHLLEFQKRLYFEKATDWENEDEFRFVIFECNNDLFFEYKNSLKGILFGQDCKESDISKIIKLTKNTSIQFQKLKWRNCAPWFELERTSWE